MAAIPPMKAVSFAALTGPQLAPGIESLHCAGVHPNVEPTSRLVGPQNAERPSEPNGSLLLPPQQEMICTR